MKCSKKRLWIRRVIACILTIALCSSVALAKTEIENGFSPDLQALFDEYCAKCEWDKDKFFTLEWTDTFIRNGETKDFEFKRMADYQKEYLADHILTTRKYLGLSATGRFSGVLGGGSTIVAMAESQVGLPDSVESPLGSNNVKYNSWYYHRSVSGEDYPWCAVFVNWCANECGLVATGLYPTTASCNFLYSHMTDSMGFESYMIPNTTPMGGASYTPVPGDLMFFHDTTTSNLSAFEHVGIITEIKENGWYCVEGNSSNKVSRNWYGQDTLNSSTRVSKGFVVHVQYPEISDGPEGVYSFLTDIMGMSKAAAIGALGNMQRESGLRADTVEIGFTMETGAGYGLIQWTNTDSHGRVSGLDTENLLSREDTYRPVNGHRRTNLINWCTINGYDYRTATGQLYFLQYEMDYYPTYRDAIAKMNSQPDTLEGAKECTKIWLTYIEGIYSDAEFSKRSANTVTFWNKFGN